MAPFSALLVLILVAFGHISVSPPKLPKWVAVAVSSTLDNPVFTVDLTIGNNYQPLVLQLDTKHHQLWVNPDCANAIDDASGEGPTAAQCAGLPRYSPERSASTKDLRLKFSYHDGNSSAVGSYFRDDVRINERTVKNLHFGVVNESKRLGIGRLGLAPPQGSEEDEAFADGAQKSFLAHLQSQGLIDRRAFSLNLPAPGKHGGALIFGGIDTKKYRGNLARFAAPTNSLQIPLTDVGQSRTDAPPTTYDCGFWAEGNRTSAPAILDSTSPFVVLSDQLAMVIGLGYPEAKYDQKHRLFLVRCEAPSVSIDFSFGDGKIMKTIHVPYANFVFRVNRKSDDDHSVCTFGIIPSATKFSITLGGAFLQGAYVTFDSESREVWIGEAGGCGEDILTITEDGGIPVVEGCK